MTQENTKTIHIKTIRELMGLEPEIFGLPVAEPLKVIEPPPLPPLATQESAPAKVLPAAPVPSLPELDLREFGSPLSRFLSRDYVRYPLIFLVALGFFYALLNFRAISLQVTGWFASFSNHEEKGITDEVLPEYTQAMKKYYVYIGTPEVLFLKNDPDGDGLINIYEFYLGTNPLKVDTDEDGYDDGREVLNGYNPLYEGKLLAWEEKVISEKIDLESVQSRKNLREFEIRVAGEQYSSLLIGNFELDPNKPGNILIPKIGMDAKITWTRDFTKIEEDLQYGVAHHPATPYPGQLGTASINGHSSGDPWDRDAKTVFTKLNFLEPGDEVFVMVYNAIGESRKYRYIVRSKKIYDKTDPEQFADHDGYFLNLSTCWPVGTARERYVVTTELIGL